MKKLSMYFCLILTTSTLGCSSEDVKDAEDVKQEEKVIPLQSRLENEYPEILDYIRENELVNFEAITIDSLSSENFVFQGNKTPKGLTSDPTHIVVKDISIYAFYFFLQAQLDANNKEHLYDFQIFSFQDDVELQRLIDFIPEWNNLRYSQIKDSNFYDFFVVDDKLIHFNKSIFYDGIVEQMSL